MAYPQYKYRLLHNGIKSLFGPRFHRSSFFFLPTASAAGIAIAASSMSIQLHHLLLKSLEIQAKEIRFHLIFVQPDLQQVLEIFVVQNSSANASRPISSKEIKATKNCVNFIELPIALTL